MSKTIEEQVEELRTSKPFTWHNNPHENTEALNVMKKALQERDRIAYERGHADALRTLPVYETDNITSDK